MPWFLLLLLLGFSPLSRGEDTVLIVGDSLSAAYNMAVEDGWVALAEKRLLERGCDLRFVNASISGETTAGGLTRLPKLLETHHPTVVMIELGGNDGLRGFSAKRVRDNLAVMVRRSREAGAKVLLLGIRVPTNYGRRYAEALAGVFPALAEELDLPLVPFLLEGVALDPALMQADGIHPNETAQPLLADAVVPALDPLLASCPAEGAQDG